MRELLPGMVAEANAAGIALQYEWREWWDDFLAGEPMPHWRGLLPVNESNNYSLRRIASIYRRSDGKYVGAYHYPHSTGNKNSGGVVTKTARGAQRYLERQLAKFWEPPSIRNPVS